MQQYLSQRFLLGGVNLQEIFLTNDMFPITCDNILQ